MDAGSAGRVSPESALHHQGTTGAVPIAAQFTLSASTWTPSPHLDSQSRNDLRQASVALDTAYERITSLRNSINDMLQRTPPEAGGAAASAGATDTTTSPPRPSHSLSHDSSIRPPHSALVLSSGQAVEQLNLRAARLRTLISPSARQRLEEFESNNQHNPRRESAWDRLSQSPRLDRNGDVRPVATRPRTPPMPDLVLPRSRDLVHSRAAQRRDLQHANRDDSSTMIGRRVAARVNPSDGHGNLSSRLSLSQIEQRLQAQTAQIARELENMTDRLAAQRSRRVELAASGARDDHAVQDNRAFAPPQTNASDDLMAVPNPPVGGRSLRPLRDVTLVDDGTRIVLPQSMSRTSSDGAPIDSRRSLSAAFRDHIASYRDVAQGGDVPLDTPRNLAHAPEARGTLVSLLARDRDDQLLSARQAEFIRPGIDTGRRDDTLVRSNPSSPAGQGRRRRGWTRLNADGDEIDSDEDDNVSPYTRRLRMRFAYGTANVDQPATRSHTVTIEDILWRTSGSDSEADVLSPDPTDGCPSFFQGSPPRPLARCPHPLPTPLEDMLMHPAAKPPQGPRMICVSKYASLAGR